MGLLDDMENKVVTSVLGSSSNPLAANLLQMINSHPGGLAGLVQSFQEKGLGEIANSWVSTGQNLPISADQVQQGMGSSVLQQLAAQTGITPQVAGSQLSALLPTLIDKLTPNGQMPQQGSLMDVGMKILNSLGKSSAA